MLHSYKGIPGSSESRFDPLDYILAWFYAFANATKGVSRFTLESPDILSRRKEILKKRGYMSKKVKTIPKFKSEAEEPRFWETHDSTEYFDSSKMVRSRFPNIKPSTTSISLRLPLSLLEAIRIEANKRDVPYQSLIKVWLSERLTQISKMKAAG